MNDLAKAKLLVLIFGVVAAILIYGLAVDTYRSIHNLASQHYPITE